MGIVDRAIAVGFDLEVAITLDDERSKERQDAETRQMEVLAAAMNVTLTQSAVTATEQ